MSSTGHTTRSAGPAGNEPERPSQGPLAERELRLALVLNGGVSLAVWMGGVTQEIDILRRVGFASGAGATDPQPTDEFWLALLSGLGIRVVVDVIAGTSAGGLNGAILGTAIARGCSVPDLRKTWIELGDFDSKLLDRDAQSVAKSVLRGKYFLCELIRLFQDRLRAPQQPAAEAEIDVCEKDDQATPSLGKDRLRAGRQRLKCALRRESHLPRAMLLFLTGTALRGTSKTHQDEIRNRFAYPDHRLRFTFRRNVAGDVDQFADDDGYEASRRLARAGRATASFPAAFEPAFVNASGSFEGLLSCEPDGAALDTPEGPEMQPITDVAASRWVIDGGVLDNEPFEPILDEIRLRPLAGDVERALIYVVPALADPEEPAPSDDASKPPGVMASVLAAFNLPRDLDVLGDLERLRQLQLESDVDRATRRRLAIRAMEGRLTSAANELYQHYRCRRRDATIWESRMIATAAHREGGVDLRALPEPEELGEGGLEHPWIPPEAKPWESSDDPAAEWRWGLSTADRFVRWGLALVRDAWADPPPAVTLTALSEASVTLSACLVELHEMSTRFSEQVAAALGDNALVLDDLEVLRLADASFRVAAEMDDGMKGSSAIGEIVAAAADAMVSLRPVLSARLPALPMDTGEAARALILAQLQVDVVERAAAPAMAPQPGPRFRFHRFDLDAPTSFLMQGLNPKQKLTGTKLNHFGAFFKRVWRAYDWTWGRLDGASHLIETVVTDRAICRVAASSGEQLERLRECLTTIVPDRESDIDRTLQQVQQSCRETGDPPPASMEQLRGWLTAAFHRAILLHELPAVLGEWGDDAPPGLPALGVGSPDADLRQVWRAMYSDFTKTSIKDLTSSSKGRAIAGESIASALRALTLDEHVPNAANSHLRRAARAVRLGTHPRVTRLRRMLRRLNPRRW